MSIRTCYLQHRSRKRWGVRTWLVRTYVWVAGGTSSRAKGVLGAAAATRFKFIWLVVEFGCARARVDRCGPLGTHVSTRSLFHLYFALPHRARGSPEGLFAPGETFAGVGESRSRSRRHASPSGWRRGAGAREAGAFRGKSEGSPPRWKKISICVLAAAPCALGRGRRRTESPPPGVPHRAPGGTDQ